MAGISILDSTLRDGAQGIGISFSVEDKLQIVEILDRAGVQYIEAGNPFSNPKELDFFERARALKLKNAKLVAFGSTRRKDIEAAKDKNLQAMLSVDTQVCCVFGKSWKLHVDKVLETTAEENLKMIEESCRLLKSKGRELIYDAEHFYDGYKDDRDYAMETLKAAIRGGADLICLCDTNGSVFPEDAHAIMKEVKDWIDLPIGVHFHNDCGLATANSIISVQAGAAHVQGTWLGFGERCGNTNLVETIANLQLKLGYSCLPENSMDKLTQYARNVAAVANISLYGSMPYVGKNAFAHKAGMHAGGVIKCRPSFEHIKPEKVGNKRRFPTSEISGKTVLMEKIRQIIPDIDATESSAVQVLERVKELERNGYLFEGADASFELLVRKTLGEVPKYFELLYYHIYTNFSDSESGAAAVIKIKVGDKVQLMVGEGNGPVNALDRALRKALEIFYPSLSKLKLTDYKVRVLESTNATASGVRVLINSSASSLSYTTVGVSEDVVAASWKALEDSVEYHLLKDNSTEMLEG